MHKTWRSVQKQLKRASERDILLIKGGDSQALYKLLKAELLSYGYDIMRGECSDIPSHGLGFVLKTMSRLNPSAG